MTETIHYLIALFGWFMYNFLMFNLDKDKDDAKGKAFNYKKYAATHWDNWIFTFLLAPVLVYYMNDITELMGHWLDREVPHLDIYYLGCGVLTEIVYYAISKAMAFRKVAE